MIATEYDELDRELGEFADERPGRRTSGLRVLPIAVGVVSLLALGAIVWYAYSQGVREGSETAAPLLRPDSPMKERPADPGGREIAGTELGIYDRISGEDGTTASVERILPPPEEPRFPSLQSSPTAPVSEVPAPTVTTSSERSSDASGVSAQSGQVPASRPPVPAPDAVLAAPTSPPPTAGSDTQQTAAAPVQPVAEPPPPPTPTPAQSATAEAPASPAGSAGTGWRIQIAALKSEGEARAEWARRQAANTGLLGNLALEIQQATVNGTTFFRVRGGPVADADAAKALCERLKANSVGCIPVAPGK